MNVTRHKSTASGFSLSMVLVFTGISLMLLTGILLWGSTNGRLTARYNEYYASVRAAEAATEKVIAHMARDFQQSDFIGVNNNLASYRVLVPTSAENGGATPYEFDDPTGPANQTYVAQLSGWQWSGLQWKYTGFQGNNAIYRIISNARNTGTGNSIIGALKQDVQIASIPLFEFGAFYALDMEVNPGVNFQVSGRVHCNGTIYCEPSANLTFTDHVTASRNILHQAHPQDSTSRIFGSVTYSGEHDGGVTSLNLPLGQSADSATLHKLIEIPPAAESPTSLLGVQRYYNKADLIILVSNTTVVATSGASNNFSPVLWSSISNFVSTNVLFYDRRESITNLTTEINVANLNAQQSALQSILTRYVRILYVADLRSGTPLIRPAIRLTNGPSLFTGGLTVATPNPLYVKGHFNAPDTTPGSTNTSLAEPASLIGDAVTVLSENWIDIESNQSIGGGHRKAGDTTVNAAILAGIVQSTNGAYSGGLENFIRLLEDWDSPSRTLTFNGSMVALFASQAAPTAPWDGISGEVYKRPVRMYSFDNNFKNPAKLPPGTPEVRALIRAEWAMIQPNATQ